MINYFTLLDLPESFDISLDELEKKFQIKAGQFHPDRFADKSVFEKKQYMHAFTSINDAYQKLQNPIKRAEYFLSLYDINYDPEMILNNDPEWLEQQLELREKIDELGDSKEIKSFEIDIQSQLNNLFTEISQAIKNKQWDSVINLVQKAKYFQKLLDVLKNKQK